MPAKSQSRPQRWSAAVSAALAAIGTMESAQTDLDNAVSEIAELAGEYSEWHGNLPENLQGSALGEKLEAAAEFEELNAEDVASALSELRAEIENAESIDLPRGFGKD